MTPEQFDALVALVRTMIAEAIQDALGRDGLSEAIQRHAAEEAARRELITPEDAA